MTVPAVTVPAGSSARTVTEPELAIGHGREGSRVLYLAYLEGYDLPTDVDGPWRELVALRPGLLFVDGEQRRSVVYRAIGSAGARVHRRQRSNSSTIEVGSTSSTSGRLEVEPKDEPNQAGRRPSVLRRRYSTDTPSFVVA